MKAIIWTRYGPPEVLELRDVPRPVPRDDEVLIKVRAANVFPGDAELRRFQMHPSMWLPIRLVMGLRRPRVAVLGQELAGEIEAVGRAVKAFKPGDAVFGSTGMRFGAYAEYACLPERAVLAPKPEQIGFEEASTIPVGGGNALHFVRNARLQPGEKILMNGACGSIGTYAVQLAKRQGAEVTAVDSADKLDVLASLGADRLIDYQQEDFTERAERYDVIFDIVGKSPFSRSLRCLAPNGRYLLANHGLTPMLRGALTSRLGNKRVFSRLADPTREDLAHLSALMARGELRAVVDRRYPLEQAVDAHRYIETGQRKGHVVLTVQRGSAPARRGMVRLDRQKQATD